MEALDGDSHWTLHFYPWWWTPEYALPLEAGETLTYTDEEQIVIRKAAANDFHLRPENIQWRRFKVKELGQWFQQEYPEDPYTCFLTSGESFFGNVEHAFSAPLNATPEAGHNYVAAVDFGQAQDYTVMLIGDIDARRVVDKLRINRLSWQDIRYRIKQKADHWHCRAVWCEYNSIGSVNFEELRRDGVQTRRFDTTAQSKPPMIQGLYYALHEAGLTVPPYDDVRQELRNFISYQTPSGAWKYEAANSGHDDCVMALAILWYGMNRVYDVELITF